MSVVDQQHDDSPVDDADRLRIELYRRKDELVGLRVRAQKWQKRLDTAHDKAARGTAQHYLAKARGQIADVERDVRRLEWKLERMEMRRHDTDEFPVSMTPPHVGWTLRTTRNLMVAGKVIPRNQAITEAQLSQMANAGQLLSGSHIRWMPPSVEKPVRPPAPVGPAARHVPSDPVAECAHALAKIAREQNVTMIDAEDLVSPSTWQRAMSAFVAEPQVVNGGAWGSGGVKTQSGRGTSRRALDMDAFRQRLREIAQPKQREVA
jgi:hypothetical protein